MHIAFATLYDPRDPRRGSGTFYFLGRELERQGHRVDYIGPVDYSRRPFISRLLQSLARARNRRYRAYQDVWVARRIGSRVGQELRGSRAEVLLTNDYSIAGFTPCRHPIAIFTDAVFPRRYRDQRHPWLENLFAPNVFSCQYVTRRGLEKALLWCFPSDWAIETALDYRVPGSAERVERVELGANLENPPPAQAARRSFSQVTERGALRVLFVGNRDWRLKGGDVAVETVRELRRRGIEATLDLAGARPPEPLGESWIRAHGAIDKVSDPGRLDELYAASDLLLVPSRAEGFGVIFAEAAAYGLPSISYDSGSGVNNAIRHGETGLLLPMESGPADFADTIGRFYEEPDLYERLARGGRVFFESTVSWPRAVERLIEALEARLPTS